MSTAGEIIRELHRLHRHARDLRAEIEKGPRLIKQQQAKLERHEKAVRDVHDTLKHLKVSQHEKETTLKGTHQQIAKYEKQLDTAGSKKEFDALQTEIAHAKETCAALEDQILATMGEIDERTAQIPVVEKELAAVKVESAGAGQEAQERYHRLTKDLHETLALLAEAEKGIPESIRKVYDKQIGAHGADGIAVVQDKTCMACYAGVTQQQLRELESGQFGLCKTCGRLVYV
jgi:predicted  nucleic acid-binding Zn-ribbon protein